MCKTTKFRALFYNAMIDVYSARWNEKHKLLSLLWKLQGDLVADVVPTFGTPGLLLSGFLMFVFSSRIKLLNPCINIVLETYILEFQFNFLFFHWKPYLKKVSDNLLILFSE